MTGRVLVRRAGKIALYAVAAYVALTFIVGGLGLLLLWYWDKAGG